MSIAGLVAKQPLRNGMRGIDVKAVQLALRAAGHELIVDGDYGAITQAAVQDFQHAHGIKADGIVGPITARWLDAAFEGAVAQPISPLHDAPLASSKSVAPWLSVMRAITGTKELSGAADSPVILGWVREIVEAYPDLKGTVGWYDHDSIPWCGLGVAYCMAKAGYRPPKLALGAANWFNDWQNGLHLDEPALGAVLVKSRHGGGHVTLYEGEDSDFYYCRGGNQSDEVNVAAIRKDKTILGFMWPAGAPLPLGGRVHKTFAQAKAGGSEA